VAILPVALILVLFSEEILLLWTRSPVTAGHAHLLMSMLVAGTSVNALMHAPYALQLASGWTRLAFLSNLVSVLLMVPLMIALVTCYGAPGAAGVWIIVNVGAMLFTVPIVHRRLLPSATWRWYRDDIGRPLLAAAAVAAIGRLLVKAAWPALPLLAGLAAVSLGTLAAAALAAKQLDIVARGRSLAVALGFRHIHPGNTC
jgi:hypothetical protein